LLVSFEVSQGQVIEYRQEEGRVERTLRLDGAVKAREAFAFPLGSRFTIDEPPPRLVRLSVAPPAESAAPAQSPRSAFDAPLWMQVEAVLGRGAAFVDDSPGEDAP
jgi:hypothetical protein